MSSQPAAGAPAVTWRITYQNEGFDTTPGAPVVRGVTVGFTVNGSIQSSVFVPASMFTPQYVWEQVNAAAQQIAAVQALSHASPPGA